MKKKRWPVLLLLACAAAGLAAFLAFRQGGEPSPAPDRTPDQPSAFREKESLLREQALAEWVEASLSGTPAGEAGNAVFFSVCGGDSRAGVYLGTGETLEEAWNAAADAAEDAAEDPVWVKADIVYHSERLTAADTAAAVAQSQENFFRYGLAFDGSFRTALLEAELNGAKLLDYENGGVDLEGLNRYLTAAGREPLEDLPEEYLVFGTAGWLCGEDGQVVKLNAGGAGYGRRTVDLIEKDDAETLMRGAAAYLADQVKEDGSFTYGYYPQFDQEIGDYNMLRHAGAVWSLSRAYRAAPDEALAEKLHLAVEYLLDQTGFDEGGRAFLIEPESGEVKLGGGAMALLALVEYTEAFQTAEYLADCRALGGGLIAMLDPETGAFVHVLNTDLTVKDQFRAASYDSEAAYALARLYGLTGEPVWLEAAQMAVDRMIGEDYTQYKDPWVSYAMSEITRYVTDRPDYYTFALENAQKNLKEIYEEETASPTYLELLLAAFELYDRLVEAGGSAEGFELEALLATVYVRADRLLDGCFYPESAMYMQNPQRILGAFMVRQDGFRVRIDDMQHSICGLYLYAENYERLVARGLLG